MADQLFNSPSSASGNLEEDKTKLEAELEEFVMEQRQRAQLSATILEFSDSCWDKCVEKPGSKLDSKTETCLTNCVERFIDTSLFITTRFAQMLQKSINQ